MTKKVYAYCEPSKIVLLTDESYFIGQQYDQYIKTEYGEDKVDFKGNMKDITRYMKQWLNLWDEVIIVSNSEIEPVGNIIKVITPEEVVDEWKK